MKHLPPLGIWNRSAVDTRSWCPKAARIASCWQPLVKCEAPKAPKKTVQEKSGEQGEQAVDYIFMIMHMIIHTDKKWLKKYAYIYTDFFHVHYSIYNVVHRLVSWYPIVSFFPD